MALDAQQHEKILGRKIGAWESNTDIRTGERKKKKPSEKERGGFIDAILE